MHLSRRRVVGALLLLVAGVATFLFAGGQVSMCLGPLNVTEIQCAKAIGRVPTVGHAPLAAALFTALGALIVAPIPARRRLGAVGAALIAAIGTAVAFVATWESVWTGVDSAGAPVSMDRPLDVDALATAVVVAATLGAMAWAHVVGPLATRTGLIRKSG